MCEYIGYETNPCGCAELVKVKGERETLANSVTRLRGELDEVKSWLKETRAGWAGSDNEFTEAYGELCEMLGVELTEEVEVSVSMTQVIKIRRPIGVELDHNDLYARSYTELYSNSDDIEVIDHISDVIIDEVEDR